MITGLRSPTDLLRIVEELWKAWLGLSYKVGDREVRVSAKAGVAMHPSDGHDAGTLLGRAETALSTAKASGTPLAAYTARLSEQFKERVTLEHSLQRALEREEFALYYQPKVDLDKRSLQGVEALMRWRSPDLGLVSPDRFIPLLEESGLIVEAGAWAMRQATLDRSRWRELGLPAPRVAVNVSVVQLLRDDFVRTVSRAVHLAGSDPGLDIEVTESHIMEDIEKNLVKLAAIRDLGVRIALDDFGTGFSSLAYVAKLPVHTVKVDRSFVAGMLTDSGAMTLVSTVISLAHALKLETVAEAVEVEEQAKMLRLLRCDQMQGYLISKPLPFDDLTNFLRQRPH
jgi:EAL domain-containing protein (putative c-di-GMP-specific phosphodiesterase class I)